MSETPRPDFDEDAKEPLEDLEDAPEVKGYATPPAGETEDDPEDEVGGG